MSTARCCVLLAAVCAVFTAPSTARAESDENAATAGCSSQSDMPSPWLGLGLICLGGLMRRR